MMISGLSYYQPLYSIESQSVNVTQSSESNEQENSNNQYELTQDQKMQVIELQRRDLEVRTHEAAHMSAGAGLTTGASYSYQRGPDNKMYAIGGEVGIDTSPGKTPEETLKKAAQIKRAALAPAQPSSADLQVAATATNMELDAKMEIQKNQNQETKEKTEQNSQNSQSSQDTSSYLNEQRKNPYNSALNSSYMPTTIGNF
ncbi:putative metalloprotease CJM1_0395 family protein [Campylobacter lanienae]|uniref:putative metalloprotease CJM1_0395 family protein n=1 Tax=Campylobacter lanienae TaxID=75658 RepID=UPI00242CFDA7|nr:putative metalloprotease CJM1_0395 family protein [Campylobacter lanienae]MDD7514045.1 putative metalloprotease CJM1_0395 family protein [Campylobacter lanienae]MDY3132802.1 putative metalloprotease CJM1_0395 family protein [Campylobacter lanienae]MDY5519778.1 putative metalloprotease CJM1_0395 family protein [Campylobacter lanienae]